MHTSRTDAFRRLLGLAEELMENQGVSSDTTLEEDLGKTLTLVNTDGSKSWWPELNKWIEAVKSKVRNQLIFS